MHFVAYAVIAAFAGAAIGATSAPSNASNAEIDSAGLAQKTLICRSPEAVRAFVSGKSDESISRALTRVDKQYGAGSCRIDTASMVMESPVDRVITSSGVISVMAVRIVEPIFQRFRSPVIRFAPVLEPSTDV
jgi:hypothetical protein